jgi:hypothetical protein
MAKRPVINENSTTESAMADFQNPPLVSVQRAISNAIISGSCVSGEFLSPSAFNGCTAIPKYDTSSVTNFGVDSDS